MTTYTTADGSKTTKANNGYEANEALGEDVVYGLGDDGYCISTSGSGAGESLVGFEDVPDSARLTLVTA